MSDPEEIVNLRTPFRCFKVKATRSCNGCRTLTFVRKGEYAWKPVREKNKNGGWRNDATLCNACVRSEQTPEKPGAVK